MNWLIIGAGSIGQKHLQLLAKLAPGEKLAAVDPDAKAREAVKELCGGRVAERLEDASRPDVVLVCSPTHLHWAHAMEAARSGAHVIVEKPVALDHTGEAELRAALGSRIGMVACPMRFHPGMAAIRIMLERGDAGKPRRAYAWYGHHLPLWRPGSDYRASYSADPKLGGGLFLDRIHELDYLRWLFGEPWAVVRAELGYREAQELGVKIETSARATLDYEGVHVALRLDCLSRTYECGLAVKGSAGTLFWEYAPQDTPGGAVWWGHDLAQIRQVEHWLKVLRGEAAPAQSIEEGYRVLRTALACYASAETRERVILG